MELSRKEIALQHYYRELFPSSTLSLWLRYITKREFSFSLASGAYIRYLTFNNPMELQEKLVKDSPEKLDIGAVYLHRPGGVSPNNPVLGKELVFDIDLTDYVRPCCTDKGMCDQCFPLIKCAIKTMQYVLESHFGFKQILFVFSGGRGVHCWVSDPIAVTSTCRDRNNIIEYFQRLEKGEIKDTQIDSILLAYSPPPTSSSTSTKSTSTPTKSTPSKSTSTPTKSTSTPTKSTPTKSTPTKSTPSKSTPTHPNTTLPNTNSNTTSPSLSPSEREQLYRTFFPKLDQAVTKQTKHLLKAPFCIHPRTEKVCVPLTLQDLDTLSLANLPTLSSVLHNKSLLTPYLAHFTTYANSISK
ncbi:DNA primase small subunit [Nematocida homosporus]|uniref:DNA primase small subunit n=1 Tax=Nematocida homosporus TaxID=1912981 RepID=UPI002220370B|nr:DNA primase small subunit [Nematocida homosporus]KAI5185640.1 DNA primase small subunit [Nematocida homosporus]